MLKESGKDLVTSKALADVGEGTVKRARKSGQGWNGFKDETSREANKKSQESFEENE